MFSLLLKELIFDFDFPVLVMYKFIAYNAKAQDQDQDSLLVKRRNDNHSPGPVIRELVPSSYQRSELSSITKPR